MQTKTKLTIGGVIVGLGLIGFAVFFGLSDKGQIDINNRIISADQKDFKQEVLPETRAVVPNGGLMPQGGGPVPEPPKAEPPAPAEEAASSTEEEPVEESETTDTSTTDGGEAAGESDAPTQ